MESTGRAIDVDAGRRRDGQAARKALPPDQVAVGNGLRCARRGLRVTLVEPGAQAIAQHPCAFEGEPAPELTSSIYGSCAIVLEAHRVALPNYARLDGAPGAPATNPSTALKDRRCAQCWMPRSSLKPLDREMVQLRLCEELSTQDVAIRTGLTTVKTRLRRARADLAAEVGMVL